ncbi:dTDP-4-dehydrorhamnose reductase [Ornithinibacillus californiensis]|uniref:dTDP-4-dehydrorhamnose reductase n=1 Tax=Ornithinibacillus californiensis TaxID=161536 RepID=UPI00064DD99F|nr:dTDP-4-dehydrorhamnose reductase [Ornithinibacillus californiensis]
MITKVLVTGAKGQLGMDLVSALNQADYRVYGIGKRQLDVTDFEQIMSQVSKIKPDIIIHCAAYTNVNQAEQHKDTAFLINGIGTRNIAIAAESIEAKLIYISTDYVFDGADNEPYHEFSQVNPLNVYGQSKLAGEQFVRDFHSKYYIIRTSWVFGVNGENFIKKMLHLSEQNTELTVVNDQTGCPTYTVDLARAIMQIMETNRYGIYHVSNSGSCTWYELTLELFRLTNTSVKLIPCMTEEFPSPAKRPIYSVFDHMALRLNGFDTLPHWKDALDRFVKQL